MKQPVLATSFWRRSILGATVLLLACSGDKLLVPFGPPSIASITSAVAVQGTTTSVTIAGSNFVSGATIVDVSGTGVTVGTVDVTSSTALTANLDVASSASLGQRFVTVRTAGGASDETPFTVNPPGPTLTTLTPGIAVRGATTPLSLVGTNFVTGATTVAVSGADVSVQNVSVGSATTLSADLVVASTAALGDRTVTVTTAGGTTTSQTITVNPPAPTLAGIAPAVGVLGTAVSVTLTGTEFVAGATSVAIDGAGVSVSAVNVASATSLTATFTVAATASLGGRNVTVTTAGGTSVTRTFTVNPTAPALTTVSPAIGVRGTTVAVTLTGSNFVAGATSVAISGTGITVSNVNVASASSLTVDFIIAAGATLGDRTVTFSTAGGTSPGQIFTVNPPLPTLTNVTPNVGVTGTTLNVTLTGTDFISGATTVGVSGAGVTTSNVNVASATSLTVDLVIAAGATLGGHDVTVTTAGGTSGVQSFIVNPPAPTLSSVAPALGVQGVSGSVTLTGTNFVAGATTVNVSGTNVTVSNVTVSSPTTLTADFAVGSSATVGARTVSVTTAGGTSGTQNFTVTVPAPTLAGLSLTAGAQTGSQTITLTGSNFQTGATTVSVSGTGVTVSNVNVSGASSLTADFAVGSGAALGARTVTVTTAGGTSGAQAFTVIAAPSINSFDALATHLAAAQPSRLRWSTSNAASCSINNGVGVLVNCTDSLFVTPGTTKTYTLTATSAGASVTANFQLFANEPGRWVYSTSSGGAVGTHVHQFSLDATTGDLTAIGAGTVAAGNTTQGLAVDPAGKYLYVVNAGTSDNVSMYSIDATTGALSALGTIAAGSDPIEIVVDPTGRFAYVANQGGTISRYTIDGTGHLVANGTNTIGTQPRGITIDGTGRFLYATNRDDQTISEFAINPDGTLASLGTLVVAGGGNSRPYHVTGDASGRFLYVTHDSRGGYSQYRIESNGTLTLITGPILLSTPVGTVDAIALDPTDRFAYIVDFNNAIFHEFTIDQATGALTRFAAPTLPHTLVTTQTTRHLAIDPQGRFAYATDGNNGNIIIFAIDVTGALSPVAAPLKLLAAGTSPFGIVVSR